MTSMPSGSTAPAEVERPETHEAAAPELPWLVIVWNDPINLMSYVTYVFQKLFGYSRPKAHKLMLDVHYKGRAVVSERAQGARRSSTSPGFISTGYGQRWSTAGELQATDSPSARRRLRGAARRRRA